MRWKCKWPLARLARESWQPYCLTASRNPESRLRGVCRSWIELRKFGLRYDISQNVEFLLKYHDLRVSSTQLLSIFGSKCTKLKLTIIGPGVASNINIRTWTSFLRAQHQENMKMLNFCLILLNPLNSKLRKISRKKKRDLLFFYFFLLIFLSFELSRLSKIKQKLSIFMFSWCNCLGPSIALLSIPHRPSWQSTKFQTGQWISIGQIYSTNCPAANCQKREPSIAILPYMIYPSSSETGLCQIMQWAYLTLLVLNY